MSLLLCLRCLCLARLSLRRRCAVKVCWTLEWILECLARCFGGHTPGGPGLEGDAVLELGRGYLLNFTGHVSLVGVLNAVGHDLSIEELSVPLWAIRVSLLELLLLFGVVRVPRLGLLSLIGVLNVLGPASLPGELPKRPV